MDDNRVEKFVQALQEMLDVSGRNENTSIFPNAEVIDTAPSGMTDYIIVKGPENVYIPVLKLASMTYTVGDYVNVLFVRGSEPLAFGYGSSSSTSGGTTGNNCVVNELSADLTIPDGTTCIRGETIVPAGITLTIDSGGRLVIV